MGESNSSDLQVFLPTYNRPEFLRRTIRSVLDQSIAVPHICVLDNGGFPGTRAIVEEFADHGIDYRDTREFGFLGNFIAAQNLLQREYVLLLHDDDLIHPRYLETAMQVLNSVPDINLLTAHTIPWDIHEPPAELPCPGTNGHLFSARQYATYVYNARHPSYSLAIYRRDAFQALQVQQNHDCYGKWGDVPLMLGTIGSGKAAVLTDACGWMGLHPGQDSNDASTRPPYQAWIAREANFLKFMGDDPRTLSGLSFCIMNYRHMRSGYKRRVRQEIPFKRFLDEARAANALTKRGERFRFISFRFVQKLLEAGLARYYRSSIRPLFGPPD